jgi:hypothetical protein
MRVFVLGTGRCGTATFSAACSHFENYSSGHESRAREIGDDRLAYPDMHIEADNRLSWFLGGLARRFDDTDVIYVHLRRDRDDVIDSFVDRWDSPYRANIVRAFGHGIVTRTRDWDTHDIARVCGFYVDAVTENIAEFLRSRPSMEIWIESAAATFGTFTERIGAVGDDSAALAELTLRHNRR